MSKTPVRDALQKLSQEELIEILPSRGFRLQNTSDREIIELYQLRCAIEGYCCYCLALRYKADSNCPEIAQLKRSLAEQANAVLIGKTSIEFLPIDRAFHNIIISSVRNRRFNSIMDNNRDRISDFVLRSLEAKGILDITVNEHKMIVDAICSKDPITSQKAMLKHLDTPLRTNLISQSSGK
jgi:DNA-binding GntR family transcriptional regulator